MQSLASKVLLSGAVCLIAVDQAPAQEAAEPMLEEVTVTARRVEENLQRVPLAVTAITPDVIDKGAVYDAFTLMKEVPGLHTYSRSNRGNGTTPNLARIRGITGLAYYFADAPYQNVLWTYYAPFFDVEGIQVLKGPQGTLFGQASNAGAILVQPRRPGNALSGYTKVEVGSYDQRNLEGAVDIPLVADRLLTRLAAKTLHRDGYVRSVIGNGRLGNDQANIARATLVWNASDAIRTETIFQYEYVKDVGHPVRALTDFNMLPASQNPQITQQAAANNMTVAQFLAARDRILAQQIALGPYRFQGWSLGCPASDLSSATTSTVPGPNVESVVPQSCPPGGDQATDYVVNNKLSWDINDSFSVKHIYAQTWGRARRLAFDNDLSRLIIQESNPKNLVFDDLPRTWSHELQMVAKLFDARVNLVSGVFGYRQFSRSTQPSFGAYTTTLADTATRNMNETKSYGAYVQANYDLSAIVPGLTFTGGVRRTKDTALTQTWVLNPVTFAINSTNGGPGTPNGEGQWYATSYTAGLQYQVTPETMLYVTNSKGHSAGGLQNVRDNERFQPDALNSVEAGVKTTLGIGDAWQLRTNASVYHGWFENVKVQQSFLTTVPGTNVPQVLLATRNAAEARVKGFEVEIQAAWRSDFELRTFANFTDNEYTSFPSVNPLTFEPVDLSGTPFAGNPRWKFGITPTYHLPVPRDRVGDLSISASYSRNSGFWGVITRPIVPSDPNNPNSGALCKQLRTAANGYGPLSADGGVAYQNCSPAWYNLNVIFDWAEVMGRPGLHASLNITNATYNKTPNGNATIYDILGFTAMDPTPPRQFSLSLRYDF